MNLCFLKKHALNKKNKKISTKSTYLFIHSPNFVLRHDFYGQCVTTIEDMLVWSWPHLITFIFQLAIKDRLIYIYTHAHIFYMWLFADIWIFTLSSIFKRSSVYLELIRLLKLYINLEIASIWYIPWESGRGCKSAGFLYDNDKGVGAYCALIIEGK